MNQFTEVDKLIERIKALMPKTVYLLKNKGRYEEILHAISEIASCVVEADENAKVKVEPDPLTSAALCLEITTSMVIVSQIDKFSRAITKANNFEICPRTDGLLEINFVFDDAFVPAPPCDNNKETKQ